MGEQVKYFTLDGEYLAELPDEGQQTPTESVVPSRAAQWAVLAALAGITGIVVALSLVAAQLKDWISHW